LKKRSPIEAYFFAIFSDHDNNLFLRLKKRSPIEAWKSGCPAPSSAPFLRLKKRSPIEADYTCQKSYNQPNTFLRLKKRSPIEASRCLERRLKQL